MHNYKNRFKNFIKVGQNDVKIKKELVDESTMKYFGITITNPQSIDGISYSKGFYTIPLADGEAYTFSQINQLEDIGDKKFNATASVYTASSGWTGDCHADPKTFEKDPEGPTLSYKIKAVISKDDKGKYTLLEYVR